ncbi:ABC transporter permease [Frondihabitans sp. PAMC 28766]|uniref:ABC transporter permease n=1 Tax=Frondihabitans sp. PAMC 28766 TaxID=1795630 RepID=UPI001EF4A109
MRTARFIAFRLLAMIVVLLVIAAITYAIFYLLPTNPARLSCGKPCTPENLARVKAYLGYDLPWWQQFGEYLRGVVAGRTYGSGASAVVCGAPCFGYSFQLNDTVTDLIVQRLPVTASIAIGAAIVWLVFGVAGGVVSALRRGTLLDRGIMTIAIAGCRRRHTWWASSRSCCSGSPGRSCPPAATSRSATTPSAGSRTSCCRG